MLQVQGRRWDVVGQAGSRISFHDAAPYHEIFDVLHRAFGDSPGILPSTRMADFEVLEHSIVKHAGYDADEFVGLLRLVLDGTMPSAS